MNIRNEHDQFFISIGESHAKKYGMHGMPYFIIFILLAGSVDLGEGSDALGDLLVGGDIVGHRARVIGLVGGHIEIAGAG